MLILICYETIVKLKKFQEQNVSSQTFVGSASSAKNSGMSISPIVNKMSTPTREANFQRHLADKKKAQLFPRHPKAVANDFEAFVGMVP